ncbi:DMT family transporter [Denitromonas ohlonensis]|uniref:DMT family transporter n=2 Tax=Denitromonas TaxID=139331 RepID=A0A557SE51_9RHOO|nr:DMT family transporter [Denitromonas ohlonensis]TVO65034.1 DMT family transporter [Denitromonas ohlonensis]TVO75707.1 DMT family transporter [Denitromonas ohlonensis]
MTKISQPAAQTLQHRAGPPSDDPTASSADAWRGLAAAAVVVLCWSGFNIVSRFGSTGAFTPYDMAALRYAVSGTLALPFFIRDIPVAHYLRYLTLALFGGLGYALFAYSGFALAPSTHAGVFVNGGIPFWTAVLLALTTGLQRSRKIVVSLVLTTAGLVLISAESLFAPLAQGQWLGDVLFLCAAASWAIFGLLVRRWQPGARNAVVGIAGFSSVIYLPIYFLWLPKTIQSASWGDLALQGIYQGIVAALLAAGMYAYATARIGASRASMALALVPAVSAVGAYALLDEPISLLAGIGIVVVSAGAGLGAWAPRRKAHA